MTYETVDLSEKLVVGIQKTTTNQNMQAVNDIALLWQEFHASGAYQGVQNKADQLTIGLYTDYEGDFTKPYNFVACCEVKSIDTLEAPFVQKVIPSGTYAKFTVRGHIQSAVGEAWQAIWSLDLPRKYSSDFEVYHNNSKDITDQIIDIYIALT